MTRAIDFSKGVRGKFYRPKVRLNLPVYLDRDVRQFVQRLADTKGTDVSAVVNRLLRSDIELVKAAK